jgi:hypothetical protein
MMFGSKARRIAQLEESLADKERLLNIQQIGWKENEVKTAALRNQVEYFVRTIRQMDDQIFGLSQAMPNVAAARPYITVLSDGMTSRKVAESNRIADVLRPQLIETYTESNRDSSIKRIK